jgi:hypothetical protein
MKFAGKKPFEDATTRATDQTDQPVSSLGSLREATNNYWSLAMGSKREELLKFSHRKEENLNQNKIKTEPILFVCRLYIVNIRKNYSSAVVFQARTTFYFPTQQEQRVFI